MENYTSKEEQPNKLFENFLDILESFVLAIACVILFFIFFARLSIVEGPSMESTLHSGDYIIVSNIFFTYTPENGDIVVIHGSFNNDIYDDYSSPIVKRIIATEGQTVEIDFKTKSVFVDGNKIDESYAQYIDATLYPSLDGCYDNITGVFTATVPKNHVFVMGDNRNHSADSRINQIGFVDIDFIVGKAIFRILPFSKIGTL